MLYSPLYHQFLVQNWSCSRCSTNEWVNEWCPFRSHPFCEDPPDPLSRFNLSLPLLFFFFFYCVLSLSGLFWGHLCTNLSVFPRRLWLSKARDYILFFTMSLLWVWQVVWHTVGAWEACAELNPLHWPHLRSKILRWELLVMKLSSKAVGSISGLSHQWALPGPWAPVLSDWGSQVTQLFFPSLQRGDSSCYASPFHL